MAEITCSAPRTSPILAFSRTSPLHCRYWSEFELVNGLTKPYAAKQLNITADIDTTITTNSNVSFVLLVLAVVTFTLLVWLSNALVNLGIDSCTLGFSSSSLIAVFNFSLIIIIHLHFFELSI
jgi:hypothetical protein